MISFDSMLAGFVLVIRINLLSLHTATSHTVITKRKKGTFSFFFLLLLPVMLEIIHVLVGFDLHKETVIYLVLTI